jgi:hypothetical protein
MTPNGVYIEYVQNQVPFKELEEVVVVFNGSKESFDLTGWRLVYENMDSGEEIHTHHFYKLKGSFSPGERLCVISKEGTDGFSAEGEERRFWGAHWDLFTDHPLLLLNHRRISRSVWTAACSPPLFFRRERDFSPLFKVAKCGLDSGSHPVTTCDWF